jgi:translation initiation factor IF-2
MTTSDDKKDGKLTVSNMPKLSLTQTVESGKVQQNLRGKQNTVTVEVRRTRTFSPSGQENDNSGLTESEKIARREALEKAAQVTEEPTTPLKKARPKVDEEIKKPDSRSKEAKKNDPLPSPEDIVLPPNPEKEGSKLVLTGTARKKGIERDESYQKSSKSKSGERKRREGKLTVTQALEGGHLEKTRSMASIKRARDKAKKSEGNEEVEHKVREVVIPETITVQELANRMAARSVEVVKELMKLGMMIKQSDTIDADTAELVVAEFGHKFKRVTEADVENVIVDDDDDEKSLKSRPAVVTVMGHVDHGKTSLLDAIRKTDVAAKEAGGITQHIGAYQITLETDDRITFLDTPGHAAFTEMRSRGAKVTDLVILVVAADDGIMPQTEEAISHAKAAEVPIIVAINKIDLPGANPQKVRDALLTYELIPEELGGDVIVVEVSAKEGTNLDKLEETILLQAEMLDLKANPDRKADGAVIESKLDKGRGVVATLLIQRGTLKQGDIVIAGAGYGKIRAISNDKGENLSEAGPTLPVEVLGLSEAPMAGDAFAVVETEKQARDIAEFRQKRTRDLRAAEQSKTSVESMFVQASDDATKELPIIIKADVQGSVEAIIGSLDKISTDEVRAKVIHSGVGGINESDVSLAQNVNAIIIGFNVRANAGAKESAQRESINIRYYSVIYNALDDIKDMLSGMLDPNIREEFIGNAEIREVFKITHVGKIAGCIITDGKVKRGAGVRLVRDDVVIHEGKLKTLKRFKDEVDEVKEGTECGMAFENYEDIKAGDTIEAFEVITEERTLE